MEITTQDNQKKSPQSFRDERDTSKKQRFSISDNSKDYLRQKVQEEVQKQVKTVLQATPSPTAAGGPGTGSPRGGGDGGSPRGGGGGYLSRENSRNIQQILQSPRLRDLSTQELKEKRQRKERANREAKDATPHTPQRAVAKDSSPSETPPSETKTLSYETSKKMGSAQKLPPLEVSPAQRVQQMTKQHENKDSESHSGATSSPRPLPSEVKNTMSTGSPAGHGTKSKLMTLDDYLQQRNKHDPSSSAMKGNAQEKKQQEDKDHDGLFSDDEEEEEVEQHL